MERAVALKKLRGLLGNKLGYRVDPKAPTPEEREAAKLQLPELTQAKEQAVKARRERRDAVLAADEQYQQLLAAEKQARKLVEDAFSKARRYKFQVGVSNSMFFHIKAEGDSWEDVIAKLSK